MTIAAGGTEMPTFPNQCVWWAQTTEARNSNLLQGMCWEGGSADHKRAAAAQEANKPESA